MTNLDIILVFFCLYFLFSLMVFLLLVWGQKLLIWCIFEEPRSTQFVHSCYLIVWKLQLLKSLFIYDCSEHHSNLAPTYHMLQQDLNEQDWQALETKERSYLLLKSVISKMNDIIQVLITII